MGKQYASDANTWGQCGRCGRRVRLRTLIEDGYVKGLLVEPRCYDGPHPQENIRPVDDPVAVKRPAPDRDKPKTLVNFPTFELATGLTHGSFIEIEELGSPTVSTPVTATRLALESGGGWLITSGGDNLIFNG